jgi:hypothetical protein
MAIFFALCTGLCFPFISALSRAQEEIAQRPRDSSWDVSAEEPRRKAPTLLKRCARCHDDDGTGQSTRDNFREIPDFRNHTWQSSRSDAALLVSILDGKGKHMPAHRGKISDAEARSLVVAIRAFDPKAGMRRVGDDKEEDWERRFAELERELDDLKRQLREMSRPPRKQ